MKNLNEYIIDSQIEQFLYDEIIESINEWWYLNMTHLGNLSEHQSLCESLGEFDNARAVMKKIMWHIDDEYDRKQTSYVMKIDCSDIKDIYFQRLIINIKNSNEGISGSFESFENNVVTINISINHNIEKWREEISYTILHELIHGYVDFNLKSKKSSLKDFISIKYFKSKDGFNRNDIFRNIRICTYFLDTQERNAYIGTLRTTIEKVCKKNNVDYSKLKFKEILKSLKDEYVWNIYSELNIFIENLDSKYNEYQKESIEYAYYKEFKEKKTFNQIHNELKTKFDKFKKQFMKVFAKSYCDYICSQKLPCIGGGSEYVKKLWEGYYAI